MHSFSLLHIDTVLLNKKWNYKNIVSPYIRLYYVLDGEGYIVSKNESVKLEKGYLYIIPSYTVCNLYCPASLKKMFLHCFEDNPESLMLFENIRKIRKMPATDLEATLFRRLQDLNPGRGIYHSDYDPKNYEKNELYTSYQELNQKMPVSIRLESQGITLQLISRFLTQPEQTGVSTSIPSKIKDAMRYILLNIASPITVSQLAKRANLNIDYFSRLFFQNTGVRPLVYIQEKRIERAQYLISTTLFSTAKIAEEAGFDDVSYFSKVFKKITTKSPGDYRKMQEHFNKNNSRSNLEK